MIQNKYNILIIEDDIDLRLTLCEILEISGYNVVTASNGLEGYEAVIELIPDLILCDINMPKMNGFEVLSAIKKELGANSIPKFMFLSARIQTEDKEYGLEMGADAFITKPFDTTYLLKTIDNCLSGM